MKKLLFAVAVILIQACAFTDATLQVNHSAEANFSGPLGDVSSINFSSPQLSDGRDDQFRVGYKKNGYGQNTADIFTAEPVNVIVEKALIDGLTQNNHNVLDNPRVKINGVVEKFWFETDINFWTVEFIGDVQCKLTFVDSETNETLYQSSYKGTYSEKKAGGLEKTWQMVMSRAVEKLIEDIVFDEELSEVLEAL